VEPDIKPWKLGLRTKYFWKKTEVGILIPINWFDSCNDSCFAGMKLTLHKSQVHSYRLCSDMSLQFNHAPPLPAEAVAKDASGLFYCWSLLRNNTMATNLQKFTLYYGSRRFVAWDCWTHTSWQLMQRDSDELIAVSHVHLYFLKRSMSKSIVMLPQVSNIHY